MRQMLPGRRLSVTDKISHQNYNGSELPIIITCGLAGGRVREVFTASFKSGSDTNAIAADGCVLISILLQHGYTPELLLNRLCNPPSLFGSILRAAADLDRSCVADGAEISYLQINEEILMTAPDKKVFRVTSDSYRLNPLVEQAKEARLPDHIGTCLACDCPVSAYECKPIFVALRPDANEVWAACDNADCYRSEGSPKQGAEWFVK